MTQEPPRLSPRQRYLENRQRKQNLTFSVTLSVMAVLVIVSLLSILGLVHLPLPSDFSTGTKYAGEGDVPCPTASTAPLDPGSVTVEVLNATSRLGLASDATEMLDKAGFQMKEPGNATSEYAGSVEVDAGPSSVDAAYTVARFFPDARVKLTSTTSSTVTVILGGFYEGTLSDEDFKKAMEDTSDLTGPSTCLPMDAQTAASQSGVQSGEQWGQSGSQSGE
ncbi:LytR C-terminal domain-containing protein [Actinomyces polynesiensis]|uniref:LytR C-terminal domain-containing protein n=1 Tax=Actinomyces polynesiensis TaxID=1325934 RepID=UPI0005BDF41F|nr:LytR C-terminal domain-containing protein [Actinomyces polynesiensis]